jgi:hypothetical protein
MRFWKSATLSLSVAAAIAACGGGTPAAPGGTPGPGGTAGPGGDVGEPVDRVLVNQDSDENVFALRGGRYRLAWTSSDCPDGIDMVVTKTGILPEDPSPSPFEYRKPTNIPAFNTLLQRVPPGVYTFEQAVESCAEWELRADRVGN